jgi:FkbM family methyltransferase
LPADHHPIFRCFGRDIPRSNDHFSHNFMGASIAHDFERDLTDKLKSSGRSSTTDSDPTYPDRNSEDYFEWIDLLTAVDRATDRFTMIEVGAGYGRWIANAAAALRRHTRCRDLPQKLIGIEASGRRFEMMERNCDDNGIGLSERQLIHAACTPTDKPSALLPLNDDYGASLIPDSAIAVGGLVEETPTIRLESLLTEPVDFIDMDIQGAEYGVIRAAIEKLDAFVKMIHVGTHHPTIDARLAAIFHGHGWRPRHIFTNRAINQTPYGEFQFIDGISSWENPRFL